MIQNSLYSKFSTYSYQIKRILIPLLTNVHCAGTVKWGQFEATVAQLKQLRVEAAQNTLATWTLQNTLLGQMYKSEELKQASLERYQDDVILSHRRATASLKARWGLIKSLFT